VRFEVTRTSLWDRDIAPCKGATQEDCIRVDLRTFKTPEEYQKRLGQDWFADGTNHRKVYGGIARDFPDKAWFVTIDTLEELMKFYKKHGNLVIEPSWRGTSETKIEIYDGYREWPPPPRGAQATERSEVVSETITTKRFAKIDYQLDRLLGSFVKEAIAETLDRLSVGYMPDFDIDQERLETDRFFAPVQERLERTEYMNPSFLNVAGIWADYGEDQELADALGAVISEHCNVIHGGRNVVVSKLIAIAKGLPIEPSQEGA